MQRRQSQTRTLNRIVKRLVARFKPDQIILFGSHARGTADADSDVELLVVMPLANRKRRQTTLAMQLALQDIELPKDIIIVTPEEVERQKTSPVLSSGRHCSKARRCMFDNPEVVRVVRQWVEIAEISPSPPAPLPLGEGSGRENPRRFALSQRERAAMRSSHATTASRVRANRNRSTP